MTDEELQSGIEKGDKSESLDSRAYVRVFSALRKEPSFQLPSNFAGRVMSRIDFSTERSSRDMVWLYLGLVSCFIAMGVAMAMTDFKITLGVFRFISGYPGFFAFAILFILALQWVDKKIVRRPSI